MHFCLGIRGNGIVQRFDPAPQFGDAEYLTACEIGAGDRIGRRPSAVLQISDEAGTGAVDQRVADIGGNDFTAQAMLWNQIRKFLLNQRRKIGRQTAGQIGDHRAGRSAARP